MLPVAKTHEDGWTTAAGVGGTASITSLPRQVLRSQGTVLSAHQLPRQVPAKYFGVPVASATTRSTHPRGDFYQTREVLVRCESETCSAAKMSPKRLRERESSCSRLLPLLPNLVEVHIKHPVLGWFELGGSGIFRPEVTKALGIDVPVLAWGLGIDRMALMHLGLNDLRELFTPNIESVRMRRGN